MAEQVNSPDTFGISTMTYVPATSIPDVNFNHADERLMDLFTKLALYTAEKLFTMIEGSRIPSHRIGLLIASDEGPLQSLFELGNIINGKGYVGINPSKFPNVMTSTALYYLCKTIGIKGPSTTMFITKNQLSRALQYGKIQLLKDHCDVFIVVKINERIGCFAFDIQKKSSPFTNAADLRFLIT